MNKSAGPSEPGETARRKSLGKAGEAVSGRYLESKGFRILTVNFRRKVGEIDIIAKKGRLLVFCEVKTRIGAGDCREGYSARQQKRLVEVSEEYLVENELLLPAVFDLRYDVIIVGKADDGGLEVKEHITDAFRPE